MPTSYTATRNTAVDTAEAENMRGFDLQLSTGEVEPILVHIHILDNPRIKGGDDSPHAACVKAWRDV